MRGAGDDSFSVEKVYTSLPIPLRDGHTINFLASPASGVIWRLRYRAGSTSAYKWELVGGPPLWSETGGASTTSTVPDLNGGPSVTIPLAGDYDAGWGSRMYHINGAGSNATLALCSNGAVVGVIDSYQGTAGQVTTLHAVQQWRPKRIFSVAAGAVFDVRMYIANGQMSTDYRGLSVLPVRVG